MPVNVVENDIERALRQAVQERGGVCEKVISLSRRGWPDRAVYLPGGVHLLVELKRPRGGRTAQHQQKIHSELRLLGIRVEVVKTLADIRQVMASLDRRG